MAKFTVKSRFSNAVVFESNHRNQRALYDRLEVLVSRKEIASTHATDLLNWYASRGSWAERHEAWAAFYVAKRDHPDRFSNREIAHVTGMQAIMTHMRTASGTLRRPTITLEVGAEPNMQTVVLKLNTAGARPGTIGVSQSSRFKEGSFYGYIDADKFEPRHSCNGTDVVAILQRVARDPATVISEIGRQSGRCCYCPAQLTQVQSKIAGCGKTCADHYDALYPNVAQTREILSENPDYLVGATDADRWMVEAS